MGPTVYVTALLDKDQVISALRLMTVNASRFDPAGWALGDAEDLEAAAGLIRREIAEAEAEADATCRWGRRLETGETR